jgi:hypothetical protein
MRTLRNLCRGAIAGFSGSAVMYLFRLWWELVTQYRSRDAIFGFDREADLRSARWLLARKSQSLSEEEAANIALAFHYLYGIALGCLFVNIRDWNEWMYRTSALPLATVLWLCADEIPVTLSGLSHPLRKSIASHASALIAHWLFVLVIRSMLPQGMVDKPLHHINEKR